MILRLRVLAALTLAIAAGAGCKFSVNDTIGDLTEQIDRILGKSTLPGRHLSEIAKYNDDKGGWHFTDTSEDAQEKTREAIRGLATCDYARWSEAALVVQVLSTISDEHPSALVRAEALDTLTVMAGWTEAAVPATERRTTDAEVLDALKTLREAGKLSRDDAGAAADVAGSINTLAAYRFDSAKPPPPEADARQVARVLRSQLATCRGVLRALNGTTISGFEADPRVREALDRAFVACGASAIRAALLTAAVADASEIGRTAAVRDLAVVHPEIGADVLAVVLKHDMTSAVRREAARVLAQYEPKKAVPPLLRALSDDMAEVHSAAVQSLTTLTGESFGDDRAAWNSWWQSRSAAGGTSGAGTPGPK